MKKEELIEYREKIVKLLIADIDKGIYSLDMYNIINGLITSIENKESAEERKKLNEEYGEVLSKILSR